MRSNYFKYSAGQNLGGSWVRPPCSRNTRQESHWDRIGNFYRHDPSVPAEKKQK